MSDRVFHCGNCQRLGPALESGADGVICLGCGEVITKKEIKAQVATAQSVRKPSSKSESGKGESRRRSSLVAAFHDEEAEEHRRSNILLVSAISIFMLCGLSFATFKYLQGRKEAKRPRGAPTEAAVDLKSYVALDFENDDDKKIVDFLQNYLEVFYSEPLSSKRTPLIDDAGFFAGKFESYYIRNSDEADVTQLEMEAVFQTRLIQPPVWLVQAKFGEIRRDFVFKATEDGLRIDWPHMVGLGREKWESFLKEESSREAIFRVYAWRIQSEVSEGIILLRMAAPMFTGGTELAEVTPILRVPKESEVGKRLVEIFEKLPPEIDEIGFPQGPRLDDKMRQLTVRLRIEGQSKKQPVLSVEEVIAGDWVSLTDEQREEVSLTRKRLEEVVSKKNGANSGVSSELIVPTIPASPSDDGDSEESSEDQEPAESDAEAPSSEE